MSDVDLFDVAARSPVPGVRAEQFALLEQEPEPTEPVLQRQASEAGVRAKLGRPSGSKNRFQRDLVKLVEHSMGSHPLLYAARLVTGPLDDIKEFFGCETREDAGVMKERLLQKLIDRTTPTMAQVKVEHRQAVPVVFGDMEAKEVEKRLGDLLDLNANEYNDLDESGE